LPGAPLIRMDGVHRMADVAQPVLGEKISSPTKKVGEPKAPRSTDLVVLSSNACLTSASCTN
jgi:hypothetical protein